MGSRSRYPSHVARRVLAVGVVLAIVGAFSVWLASPTPAPSADGPVPARRNGQAESSGRAHPPAEGVPAGALLAGVVLREDLGQPVAGLVLCCMRIRESQSALVRATTDSVGRYEFRGLPAGSVGLFTESDGWALRGDPTPSGEATDVVQVLLPAGGSVRRDLAVRAAAGARGVVLDREGRPVEDVAVAAVRASRAAASDADRMVAERRASASTTRTARDGRFRFDSLHPGTLYVFEARPCGLSMARAGPLLALPDRPIDVVLRLPSGQRVELLVTDAASGDPIPGATARIVGGLPGTWLTGPEGRAMIGPLPRGPQALVASHAEYLPMRSARVVVDGERSVRLQLERGAGLGGRLLRPEGVAIREESLDVVSAGISPDWGGDFEATTGAKQDGTFRFSGLPRGKYWIRASARGGGRRYEAAVEASTGDEDVVVRLELRPSQAGPAKAGEMILHVLAEDGTPARHVEGAVWSLDPRLGMQRDPGEAVGGGVLRVLLRRGSATRGLQRWAEVWGAGAGGGPLRGTTSGPVGEDIGEMTVMLPAGAELGGRILDSATRGVAGVRVHLRSVFATPTGEMELADRLAQAVSGSDGSFLLDGLAPGEYRLELRPPSGYTAPDSVRVAVPTAALSLRLETGTTALLTVVNEAGAPVEGAILRAGRSSARTDLRGLGMLDGLALGIPVRLEIVPEGPDLRSVRVEGWVPASTRVELPRQLCVTGTVRMADSSPAPQARVQWKSEANARWQSVPVSAGTAEFVVVDVPEGEVSLRASISTGSLVDPDLPVTVVPAGTRDVVLTVETGAVFERGVENWPRGRTGRVRAIVTRISGSHLRRAGGGPRIRLEGLRPEDVLTVWIQEEQEGLCWFAANLGPSTAPASIRLVAGRTLSGRVLLPDGAAVPSVRVVEPDVTVFPDEDGRFSVRGFPREPVAWHLCAAARVGSEYRKRTVEVPAEGEVTIDLRR